MTSLSINFYYYYALFYDDDVFYVTLFEDKARNIQLFKMIFEQMNEIITLPKYLVYINKLSRVCLYTIGAINCLGISAVTVTIIFS